MAKQSTLVIVESPAKAKTIERYLGEGYTVSASMGHLIDLPKSRIAIDADNNFEPEYITVRGKAKILKELIQKAKKTGNVLLASDNDREGEAISYHLKNAILKKEPNVTFKRITFNEITPNAIQESIKNPAEIDMNKVNAQKARRVLDRLVGYNLSPILWKKVKNGLSAGRVQSVTLKLITLRETEVENFVPEEYWTIETKLKKGKSGFPAELSKYENNPISIKSKVQADEIIKSIENADFIVKDIKESEKKLSPRPPFITSTLQQTAANRLGFTSRKTMQIAQQLYEGIKIGAGPIGLITYMRTDSTRIAAQAIKEVREYIEGKYKENLPEKPNFYSVKQGAQDAHEAIRPTYVKYEPDSIKQFLSNDQYKLYSIIWERFVSSQMVPSLTKSIAVEVEAGKGIFKANASITLKNGFQDALNLLKSKEKKTSLPSLAIGDKLTHEDFVTEQHFTQGPARYTDASIVKALEELGIGRPSTYAPIISVLLDRYYVVRKNKQLVPTVLGKVISDILSQAFPEILDVNFTAILEKQLDEVEEKNTDWVHMVRDFYAPFIKQVVHISETMESKKGILDEPTDEVCEKCGSKMVKKLGRFGFFLACSGFPACKNTKAVPLADCPVPGCNGKIVARRKARGRGREFYGCSNYPTCNFISHFKPTTTKCPKCGYFLVERYDKKNGSFKSCVNKDCDFLHTEGKDEGKDEGTD